MMKRILICTDMDRTLLPNGAQPESPNARKRFAKLVSRPDVTLAYVTGRHRELVEAAIDEFDVPVPDYVLGDVGTSIYSLDDDGWHALSSWHRDIAPDWAGLSRDAIASLFQDIAVLELQEPEKQNQFKLSYYAPHDTDTPPLLEEMRARLDDSGIKASLIWSIDETADLGLLDVIPLRATKRHAVEFLMQQEGFTLQQTLFAGDSGNDLPVLVSPIRSVLVANATEAVRRQALDLAARHNALDALYLARGGFMDMNGNYSAGILEGLAHYMPETVSWFE
ncbi:MAG: HAD-IIB family hydrolase [Pseudomonadota bacterium]